MLVLLQQYRAHQAGDRRVVGEDADDPGAEFDFLVDPLEQVGAPDLAPVVLGEVAERQHVLLGLVHQCSGLGEALRQRGRQIIPARFDLLSALLGEHRAEGGGDHALVSFVDALQQVAGKVDPAALPHAALQLAADRLGESCMGGRDHQLDASEDSLLEVGVGLAFRAAVEFRPEGLTLTVAHLEAQQLPAPVLVHAHGDDDSALAYLLSLAQPPLEVGGIEVDVGVAAALRRPAQECLHLLVDLLTDTAHLRLGDAALGAQRRHQGIHLAGRHPTDVGLHDHGVQGLIHPAAGLKDRGKEAAGTQFGELQREIAHLGGQSAGPIAVAIAEPLLGALMAVSTEEGGNLQLDQLLQASCGQLGDQFPGAAAIE